ncbi:DNA-J related domain-containing protein [Marinobacter sp.]|uniref:DNA-J related domain-containing protein n=1 Tax=Marinobacter sp. TaxID=50741 RepID=UPI00384E821D
MTSPLRSTAPAKPGPEPGTSKSRLDRQIQHLMIALESILRESPGGLSELALIKTLQVPPWELLDEVDFSKPEKLYPVHFLIFHSLYRLRDELGAAGESLDISPLLIRLYANAVVAGQGHPGEPDRLRSFYLDLDQYNLPEESISEMVDDFWSGRSGQHPAPEDTLQAAAVLGFDELPGTFSEVKHRFRRAVMQAHPDRGGSTGEVQTLNSAFGTLRAFFTRLD